MKVVHVYKDFDPPVRGGMERHVALLCRFQQEWCEVEALVCSRRARSRHEIIDGIPVTLAGEWGRFQSAPLAPGFPWRMRRIGADVTVVHSPNPTAELGWLLGRPSGALVVRYQSDVVRQASAMRVYRPFQKAFLRQAALILPTSPQYLDSSETLRPFADKCRVVPLGIVAEDFARPDEALVAQLRRRYGDPYVVFCGVHRYYKGLSWLVKAAKHIHAPVVIAGDGPERASNMALARELGVDIAFPGTLSHEELKAHLHGAALMVFPSCERSEAFGLSILEAHACGCPVVATRLGTGVEYVNEDGRTGVNVPPGDAESLARAVNALLDNPALRAEMGAYARERVYTRFDARSVARREFELYAQALAGAAS